MATSHVDVHVTHVDKEGPLIKIFGQTDKNNALFVERLLYQLRDLFDTADLRPRTFGDVAVGLICCAKFEDNVYYRAKILNIDKLRENKILLRFMDHGNVAQVKVNEVKLLSKLQGNLLADSRISTLMELPELAQQFYLAGVAPKDNEWDDETLELLRKRLCNTDVKCTIYDIEGKKILKVMKYECDPANILIGINKALPFSIQSQGNYIKSLSGSDRHKPQVPLPQQINTALPPPNVLGMLQQPPPTRLPNISQPPPIRIPHEMNPVAPVSFQSKMIRPSGVSMRPGVPGMQLRRPELPVSMPPMQNLQFSTEMLAPGSAHYVYVSHVEDGPYAFAVQLQNMVQDVLIQMMTEISSITPQPIIAPLNPGSICLGRYSLDKCLCRAIVMNVLDDKVKLYFADFGNSEVVPFSEIYQIPPQFVTTKVMSHRFTLANITSVVYTDQEKKLFKELVSGRPLMMKVTAPEANPLKQYCELFLNSVNIKSTLAELSQSNLRFAPVSTPIKGSQEKVFISFVLNPGRFFVQLDKNEFSLKQVMRCVADHCRSAPHLPVADIKPGQPCCALFDEDKSWYRAEILKLNPDNKAFINFVDYGNQEEIEIANLRQITPELVQSVKAQAIVCCLRGYESRYDVDEEISNRLEELILEQKLMMHVFGSTDNSVLIVDLIDQKSGMNIGAHLEEKPAQSPVYNNYQAPVKPVYASPPQAAAAAPKPIVDDGWEETPAATSNNWEDRRRSDTRGPRFNRVGKGSSQERRDWQPAPNKRSRQANYPWQAHWSRSRPVPIVYTDTQHTHIIYSAPNPNHYLTTPTPHDDGKKSWRSREDGDSAPRFNKDGGGRRFNQDGEQKPWNRDGEQKPWNRDDNRKFGDRSNRFGDEDKGGRYSRDSDSRGGSGRSYEDRSRFNKEDGGGRFNRDDSGGARTNRDSDSRGGNFSEDRGNRFSNRNDDDKPWKKRDDDSAGWKSSRDGNSTGSWKDRESSGGWNKDREGGGGRWKEGGGDGRSNDRRGGGFNKDSEDRSSFRKPWDRAGGDSFAKSSPKSPKPDTVGGMPFSTVKVGQTEKAEVCFTTSPVEFYVQLSNSCEELSQLMDKIATACESGDVTDMTFIKEKAGCLAKYSEDDSWYRAVIEEKSFDTVKVLFVDYGNEENVALDKIKTLPEDMSTLPVQAVKCRLLGVSEAADTEIFKALVEGKPLKTHFVAKHFISKSFEVVVIDEENNSNINVTMGASEEVLGSALSKLGSTVLTPLSFPAGTTLNTQLTWYTSPSLFYLLPMDSNPEFRAMMQAMQSVVRTGLVKQNNQLNIGDFVIARFKADKVLYRALVEETGFMPRVQYVDYGNSEAVDSGNVWAMESEFATLPIQAFSCCLAGVQPTGDAWPKPDTTDLDSHFEAETMECTVIRELDCEAQSRYLVKLVKQGEDVAQKIIDAGLAVAGSDAIGVPNELDTSLLVSQPLPVTFLRIQEDYTFFVQPATEDVELQSLESEAGQGVKCVLSNVKEDATDEQRETFTQLPPNTYVIVLVDAVNTDGLQVTLYDGEGQLLPLQESESQQVDKVCPMPVLNTHQRVWIAHASEDGIFLHKIVFADLLAELLQKLYDFYNESEPVEQEWKAGDLCCGKSVNDEQWYRARIIESGDEVKVQYIDYGNTETIPVSNVRQLDACFYTPHAFALPVCLHVTWSVPVENLLELAGETEYNAVVLRNKEGWVVELVDSSGQSLTEKLVELGFAVALDNSPFKRVVEGGRFVEGSDIPISVSFIDSPHQLWIFVGDDIELIEALQDRLQEAAAKLPSQKEPNGIFAAKFSDGLWYRAVKLDSSTVRFIDYGNSDVVDMSDIKTLSANFLEPAEGYAVKVELPVVDFKEGASEKLEELLVSSEIDHEQEIIAHILSVKENSIVADILKGGKSVVDILVEENLGTRVQKVTSGFVSNFKNLNDFFIQEVGCEENLDAVVNALSGAESFEPISQVSVGEVVAGLYTEDGLWYRAKVSNQTEEGTEVLFIDYGNSALASDFRALPSDLAAKPALSKHCALKLPSGVREWSESASEKFIEISAEGCTQFDIKVINQEDPSLVILLNNGNCVNEELKSLCDVIEEKTAETDSASADLTGYDKVVYISHTNSPNDFFVQVDGAEVVLDAIREELADVSSFESVEQLTDDIKTQIIGALFVDDELWYRAKALNVTEDGAEVLFIDYGNSAVATKFVKLPESLETKPPTALHCALGKVNWPEEANNHFLELANEGTVPFKIKFLEESELNIVSLSLEGRIVEKELLSLFVQPLSEKSVELEDRLSNHAEFETTAITADENLIKTVFLIKVNSPSDFFLHTAEATQLLGEISERLIAAEGFPFVDESSVSKGKIVAAQFDEDDLWYRARIIDHLENETKVIFIDYGNTAKVAKMKELPEDLVTTPALAMHCSLDKPGGGEWSLNACETFDKLANEDGVSFDLKILSEGEPNSVSLFINGESIAEQLILTSGLVTEEPSIQESDELETPTTPDEDFIRDSSNEVEGSIVEKTNDETTMQEGEKVLGNLHRNMEEMIMNSFGEKIIDHVHKDMQEITDDLISNAVSLSTDKTASSVQESHIDSINITGEVQEVKHDATNTSNCISDEAVIKEEIQLISETKQTTDKDNNFQATDLNNKVEIQEEIIGENIKLAIETKENDKDNNMETATTDDEEELIAEEIKLTNEPKLNIEKDITEATASNDDKVTKQEKITGEDIKLIDETKADPGKDNNSEATGDESLKSVCNGSPSTPRRSNIDDHIVPGCISSVTLEDNAES